MNLHYDVMMTSSLMRYQYHKDYKEIYQKLLGNNGSYSLILVILVRKSFGEVDVTWCGTIGNCKGGGYIWGGVALWCWRSLLISSN